MYHKMQSTADMQWADDGRCLAPPPVRLALETWAAQGDFTGLPLCDESVSYTHLIPSRYEIPDNSEHVTEAQAGDVFYSDPNRIVLYYRDAEVSEDYTKVGSFDATEEFV